MSSVYLLLLLAGVLLLLGLVLLGYMQLYMRHIAKALAGRNPRPMLSPRLLLLILIAVFLLAIPLLSLLTRPVCSAKEIEDSARTRAEELGMEVRVAVTDQLVAVLWYTEDGSDHSFSIYENQGTWRANYVFRYGGSSASIEKCLRVFRAGEEVILFSLNTPGIARIECQDGERYDLSPDTPFVRILPAAGMRFYDMEGSEIDIEQASWYEVTVIE